MPHLTTCQNVICHFYDPHTLRIMCLTAGCVSVCGYNSTLLHLYSDPLETILFTVKASKERRSIAVCLTSSIAHEFLNADLATYPPFFQSTKGFINSHCRRLPYGRYNYVFPAAAKGVWSSSGISSGFRD